MINKILDQNLNACPNLAPIERYDRFSMTMYDRPCMEKIAKMVFWKGVFISTEKPIL
jgi:hypothetical protein